MDKLKSLTQLIETVHRLRAPGGCPWDRAQTHQSLRKFVIEEAFEVVDVLDRIENQDSLNDPSLRESLKEELGDLLLQVVLHSEMTAQEKHFDIYEVAQALNDKMIRRHPHVFAKDQAQNADEALASWEKQKLQEKNKRRDSGEFVSVLEGLPKSLPALQKSERLIDKVTKVGFQWPDMQGPLLKVDEELGELRTEIEALAKAVGDDEKKALREKVSNELGDLLFTLCNVGFLLKVSPEDSLRGTLAKFQKRFEHVEKRLFEQGKKPEHSSLEEMDLYWNEAKKL